MSVRSIISLLAVLSHLQHVAAEASLPHTARLSYSTLADPQSIHTLGSIAYDAKNYLTEIRSWTPPKPPVTSSEPDTNLPLIRISTEAGSSTLTSIGAFNETLLSEEGRNLIINLSLDPDGTVYHAFLTTAVVNPDVKKISKFTKSGKPKSKARLEREAREAVRDAKLAEKARSRSAKKAASSSPTSTASVSIPTTKSSSSSQSQYPDIQVRLHPSLPGPSPKLAPPRQPRLGPDGNPLPPGARGSNSNNDDDDEKPLEKTFFQKYWWVLVLATLMLMTGGGDGK